MADSDEELLSKYRIDPDEELLSKYRVKPQEGLPDQTLEEQISNAIGGAAHGAFDTQTFGYGHKGLDKLLEKFGQEPIFQKRRDEFAKTAPVSNAVGGLAGALFTPGGKEVSGLIGGGETTSKTINALAKAAGISTDAVLAGLYNYNRAKPGEEVKDALTGAGISLGLSGLQEGGKALLNKFKPSEKLMQFMFGLPPEIQNKIKANPQILRDVKTPEELQEKLITSVNQLGKKARESSEFASKTLSNDLQDYITPEKLRSIVEGGQEELGNVKGLPLKEGAYRRLEQLKNQFPENKLFTPREVKPILQSLDQETGDYLRTSGAKSDALKDVRKRIDQILKENKEYEKQMIDTAQLTRLSKGLKQKFGLKEIQDAETGIRELIPGPSTINILKGGEKTGRADRLLEFLSNKTGSDIAQEVEKGRLANFLSQPQTINKTGASLRIPAITGIIGGALGGIEGAAAGAGLGAGLDKYGRRAGAELIGEGSRAADYLQKNKLFKEALSSQSPLNRKYAASHFIRSQTDPEYNKENSR